MNEANESEFVARRWNIVNDNSKSNYGNGNKINHHTEVLKSNLRDQNNAYILVKDNNTITGRNLATQWAFKNSASFTKCITKMDGTTIDDAEKFI